MFIGVFGMKNCIRLTGIMFATLLIAAAVVSASAQLRTVTIVSEAKATVWIDDVSYGKTDLSGRLTIRTFPTGIHRLKIRADGFKEVSQALPATGKEIKIALVKTTDAAELTFQQAEAMSLLDRDKAVELYQKAIRLNPKNADAFVGLARVYIELTDFDEALQAIQGARRARPAYSVASAVEGRAHRENGDEAKAIASFKRAITEGRGYQPEAHAGLGLLYKEKAEGFGVSGEFDSETEYYMLAAGELRKAASQLAGSPDAVVIYQFLGNCYERAKKYREAIVIYQEYIKNFPDTDDVETFQSFITQLEKRIKEEQ